MKNIEIEDNLIVRLTLEFSTMIIMYCEQLTAMRKYNLSNQLFRSGTSIGSNVWEAQNAESKTDFIHKFKIAAKEMEETKYWLLLCKKGNGIPDPNNLLIKLEEIQRIITKIISSSKKNLKNNSKKKKSTEIEISKTELFEESKSILAFD